MNRCATILFLGCLLATSLLAAPADSDINALPFTQTDLFAVPDDSILTGEQWVLARSVVIDGDARDDLFLFAGASRPGLAKPGSGTITIKGSVGGDLWAAGQKIEIYGPVERHIRAASQMLVLDNRVGGNLWVAATTVSLDTNSIVVGSARILADYIILRGTVDGNLIIRARKVILDGIVNGSVSIKASEIEVLSNTRIHGALTCESPVVPIPARQAVIDGGITHQNPVAAKEDLLFRLITTLISFIGAILAGVFFIYFSPKLVARSALWMETFPWRTLLVGLAAFTLVPLAGFILFVSLLGIPLALVTATLWGLGIYMGRFVAALSVARLLTGMRRTQPIPLPLPRLMLLGLSLFYAASFLPDFLSDAIWFWFTVTGLGGLILASRGSPLPLIPAPPPLIRPDKDAHTP